jgi:hypothetical protein
MWWISPIILILVVASDGSWSVGAVWRLVLRMLLGGVRRKLKVEFIIISDMFCFGFYWVSVYWSVCG